MKVPVEVEPIEKIVCDECGEDAICKCYFCGKDLCGSHVARVLFYDKETVRGKGITFFYDKMICKSHLPGKRICE